MPSYTAPTRNEIAFLAFVTLGVPAVALVFCVTSMIVGVLQ